MRDGVPARASTRVAAAALRLGTWSGGPATDPEKSMIKATSSPHWLLSVGLFREFCQTPPELFRLAA